MTQAEERTKVVVRHLPPSLSEEAFQSAIQEWVDRSNWFAYYRGKTSAKEQVHSRAYLNFKDPTDVIRFSAAFNGNLFVSDRGSHTRARVEYAPFQRVPRATNRRDPREGTIEKDAGYRAFLKSVDEETQAKPVALPAPQLPADPDSITPLVLFLKEKRAKDKLKAATAAAAKKGGKGAPAPKSGVQPQPKQKTSAVGKQGPSASEPGKPVRGKKAAKGATALQDPGKPGKAKSGEPGKVGAASREPEQVPTPAAKKAGAPGGAQEAEAATSSLPKHKKPPVTIQMIKRPASTGAGKADRTETANSQVQSHPPMSSKQGEPGAAKPTPSSKKHPTTILKRVGPGASSGRSQPVSDSGAPAAPSGPPPESAAAAAPPPSKGGKAVRVREGFQAFQPKRVGRLTETSGAAGANPSLASEERTTAQRLVPRKKKPGRGGTAPPGPSAGGYGQAASGG